MRDIHDFTVEAFGEAQAKKYVNGLFETFERLSQNPGMGRARPELAEDVRSFPLGSHVIFT